MSRSRKSKVLLAHYILWGGMFLASAIIIYGSEHPRRPHMIFLILAMGAFQSLFTLHRTEMSDAASDEKQAGESVE